jgi:DNA modification methylase
MMGLVKEVSRADASQMQIGYRPIAELKLDPKNPRSHTPRQIRQIARSIETFGFNVPVLIDATAKIIAGHGRVMACKHLGWSQVPTIRLDHLTEAQARAFMIADNKLTENAEWDDRLLAEQLETLATMDLDFSLDVTGFEIGEIDFRIEQISSSTDEAQVRADRLPEPVKGPSVSRPGDLWLLNEHRVLCASALEQSAYACLMKDDRAKMVFTDPPFNVRIGGNVSGSGAIRHREFAMASGEMSEKEFCKFLSKACTLLGRHSVPEALHFVCMDWRHMGELLAAGREVYSELKNVCVWVKDNAGMGSLYRSQHELVFVFKRGRRSHRNNVQLGQFGRNRTNVWNYPCANSFSRSGDEGKLLSLHPTVKPAALVADAIMDCTDRHDVVLDSFLGSGTTVIAAERTGRRCYGLELDPVYVDVIVRRWQSYTRQTAQHAETGRSFAEVEAEVAEWGPSKTTASPRTKTAK